MAAAGAAARAGAKVFLASGYPCLGEDIAGTLRLWATPAEVASSDLMRAMFGKEGEAALPEGGMLYTTPLRAKKALDRVLLDAGVPFLTGVFATDLLTDAGGSVSGAVVASRSGRQAIRAKVVIDATGRPTLARTAGAKAAPFPAGSYTVSRVVVAGQAPPHAVRHEWQADPDWVGLSAKSTLVPGLFACAMKIDFADGSMRSFLEAEQVARDRDVRPFSARRGPTGCSSSPRTTFGARFPWPRPTPIPPDWILGRCVRRGCPICMCWGRWPTSRDRWRSV